MSPKSADASPDPTKPKRRGVLDWIERLGNRLPDPATLFLIGTLLVVGVSFLAVKAGWTVQPKLPHQIEGGGVEWTDAGDPVAAKNLLSRDGIYWLFDNLVDNFTKFPPLGVVLVGMLGIGIAERTGLVGAVLKAFMLAVPPKLLTPAVVLLGILSSATSDAGYVVLPPIAAALYVAAGRSPLAGLAAVFAGIAAGFNACLIPTSLDPMLAEYTGPAAQTIDPSYQVNPVCNYYFMVVSTFLLTAVGWWITDRVIEPRLRRKPPEEGGPDTGAASDAAADIKRLKPEEVSALYSALIAFLAVASIFSMLIFIEGAPLNGKGERFPRGIDVIVPIILSSPPCPASSMGSPPSRCATTRTSPSSASNRWPRWPRSSSSPSSPPSSSSASNTPYSTKCSPYRYAGVGAKRAAQRRAHRRLHRGHHGVQPVRRLHVGKVCHVRPIFVPMLMLAGISPELTQCAYRVGDSVTNIVTPLNPYMVIILVFMRKYLPKGGIGTLISTMIPYSIPSPSSGPSSSSPGWRPACRSVPTAGWSSTRRVGSSGDVWESIR
ncbi:MAG: AbgT family transporter [Verrucomicrobiales bacterium]